MCKYPGLTVFLALIALFVIYAITTLLLHPA